MIRRLITPPAFPALVRPRPANRSEHIAAEDPRSFALHRLGREIVINARLPAFAPMLFDESLCRKEPLHQLRPANAERIVQGLICSGCKAVERYANTLNDDL